VSRITGYRQKYSILTNQSRNNQIINQRNNHSMRLVVAFAVLLLLAIVCQAKTSGVRRHVLGRRTQKRSRALTHVQAAVSTPSYSTTLYPSAIQSLGICQYSVGVYISSGKLCFKLATKTISNTCSLAQFSYCQFGTNGTPQTDQAARPQENQEYCFSSQSNGKAFTKGTFYTLLCGVSNPCSGAVLTNLMGVPAINYQ
jgi:hypothetical protein